MKTGTVLILWAAICMGVAAVSFESARSQAATWRTLLGPGHVDQQPTSYGDVTPQQALAYIEATTSGSADLQRWPPTGRIISLAVVDMQLQQGDWAQAWDLAARLVAQDPDSECGHLAKAVCERLGLALLGVALGASGLVAAGVAGPAQARRMRRFLALCLLLTLVAWGQGKFSIEGGVGAGAFRLGSSFSKIKDVMGAPQKVQPSDDSTAVLYYYPRKGVDLFVKDDHIITIAVTSSVFTTANGLHVGSPRDEVLKRLGQPETLQGDHEAYPELGLMFTYDHHDHVLQVLVIDKQGRDPLRGDYSIQAGERIGGIHIGLPVGTILQAWGRPSRSGTMPNQGNLMGLYYESHGILVLVSNNQVQGVTTVWPSFGTPEGIRVGATRQAVYRVYGPHPTDKNGIETYASLGLGFTIEHDKVTEITVLPKR